MQRYRIDHTIGDGKPGYRIYDMRKFDYVRKPDGSYPKQIEKSRDVYKEMEDLEAKRRFCITCKKEIDEGDYCSIKCEKGS